MASSSPTNSEPLKLLLVGDTRVGKSSLLARFIDDSFRDGYIGTIAMDFNIHNIALDGETIKLMIYDTSGQERFRSITSGLYKDAHGVMLVYDVTNQESFYNMKHWLHTFDGQLSEDAPRLLVGTRCDETTHRAVEYTTAKEFADQHGLLFMETSAKDGTNVEQAFITLAAAVKNTVQKTGLHLPDRITRHNARRETVTQFAYSESTYVV